MKTANDTVLERAVQNGIVTPQEAHSALVIKRRKASAKAKGKHSSKVITETILDRPPLQVNDLPTPAKGKGKRPTAKVHVKVKVPKVKKLPTVAACEKRLTALLTAVPKATKVKLTAARLALREAKERQRQTEIADIATKAAKAVEEAKEKQDKFSARHHHADNAADSGCVKRAVIARTTFCELVLGVPKGDAKAASNLLRVSGTGVTLPKFRDGIRVLANAMGHEPISQDKDGQPTYEAKSFASMRAIYNTMNGNLNILLVKARKARTDKNRVGASPAKKGGAARRALATSSFELDAAKMAQWGKNKVNALSCLMEMADSSDAILDSGAIRHLADKAEFAKAPSLPRFGRFVRLVRSSKTKVPAWMSDSLAAKVKAKGKGSDSAAELFPLACQEAKAHVGVS